MFNCTPEVAIIMILSVTVNVILKVYFRLIGSLMKSHSNLGKLAIKFKIGLTIFLFFTSETQWVVAFFTLRLICELNFLIREFWKPFTFLVILSLLPKIFEREY